MLAMFTRNFFLLLPYDLESGLVLLSMASVGLTQARKWVSNMDRIFLPQIEGKPLVPAKKFMQIWRLSTVLDVRESGNSYQFGTKAKSCIEFDSLITPDLVPYVKAACKSVEAIGNFKSVAVDADVAAHDDAPSGPSASATPDPGDDF